MFVYKINDKMSFGRYKNEGKTLLDIVMTNPSYIDFCIKMVPTFCISNDTLKDIIKIIPTFRLSKQSFAINQKKIKISQRDEFGGLYIRATLNKKKPEEHGIVQAGSNLTDLLWQKLNWT